jgi:hypothetical protein
MDRGGRLPVAEDRARGEARVILRRIARGEVPVGIAS